MYVYNIVMSFLLSLLRLPDKNVFSDTNNSKNPKTFTGKIISFSYYVKLRGAY